MKLYCITIIPSINSNNIYACVCNIDILITLSNNHNIFSSEK